MGLDNPIHIVFLVVILLLVFGAKRLPEIGRSLGGGMREFKDSVSGTHSETAQQSTLTQAQAVQQPQAPVAQPVAAPPVQVPVAQPVAAPPVQVPVEQPVAAPAQPAPVEPQHQA
jgi:sec-independent protein translocase protein TatA